MPRWDTKAVERKLSRFELALIFNMEETHMGKKALPKNTKVPMNPPPPPPSPYKQASENRVCKSCTGITRLGDCEYCGTPE